MWARLQAAWLVRRAWNTAPVNAAAARRRVVWAARAVTLLDRRRGRPVVRAQSVHAACLIGAGRASEAESAALAALARWGEQPGLDRPGLDRALALRTLAWSELAQGRSSAALVTADRAVADARLAPPRRRRTVRELVAALLLRAEVLDQLGRPHEAYEAGDEAVRLVRRASVLLAVLKTQAERDLVARLAGIERFADALEAAVEPLDTYDRTARMTPRVGQLRASLLTTIARCHLAVGQPAEALAAAERSLVDYRARDAGIELGWPLELKATALDQLDRPAEAETARAEAAARYAEGDPAQYLEALARVQAARFDAFLEAGDIEAAMATILSIVEDHRRFAAADPTVEPALAVHLGRCAWVLARAHRTAEAVAMAEEGLALSHRLLADSGPTEALARSLNVAGIALESLDRVPEALEVTHEAVTVRKAVPVVDPSHDLDLADYLRRLVILLRQLDRAAETAPLAAEAAAIYRRFPENPLAATRLAGVLQHDALGLSAGDQHEAAVDRGPRRAIVEIPD